MESIKINVNKQIDGYNFSIAPSLRQLLKSWFPDAHPANNIFVAYDVNSDFELYYGKLESYIYPALLGISNKSELRKKTDKILFIDSHTGNVMHKYELTA